MRVRGFLQTFGAGSSTIAQLLKIRAKVAPSEIYGCFAYATQSGAAKFDLAVGQGFWDNIETKWLFGIDYGRTHPKALRFMKNRPNAAVRIYDGSWVVNQTGFVPRRDFHMKATFLVDPPEHRFGMVSGSGNFSASGLIKNVECGTSLFASTDEEYTRTFRSTHQSANELCDAATPVEDLLEEYEARWTASKLPPNVAEPPPEPDFETIERFWIEAGYVTRNRGPGSPGNQIDMPRGMNRFFGFDAPADQPINSVIGPITFISPSGGEVTNNLRMGNNHMEKISLPIPEDHGLDVYDGKVLVFRAEGAKHRIWALEASDFDAAFGAKLEGIKVMGSGRRYGYITP